MLKRYQIQVVKDIEEFFEHLDKSKAATDDYVSSAFGTHPKYRQYPDRPITGQGVLYPRVCIKMPTGGGKTLIAIETIRAYQNLFAKRKTGLVVWITHRDQIYRQTIENLQNKNHVYRQFLDQASGNRTLILEKGQAIRRQDVEENLVVLMLMIQAARNKEVNKMFEDSGGYTDFFPP
jgi:type III restriction enzyme